MLPWSGLWIGTIAWISLLMKGRFRNGWSLQPLVLLPSLRPMLSKPNHHRSRRKRPLTDRRVYKCERRFHYHYTTTTKIQIKTWKRRRVEYHNWRAKWPYLVVKLHDFSVYFYPMTAPSHCLMHMHVTSRKSRSYRLARTRHEHYCCWVRNIFIGRSMKAVSQA